MRQGKTVDGTVSMNLAKEKPCMNNLPFGDGFVMYFDHDVHL